MLKQLPLIAQTLYRKAMRTLLTSALAMQRGIASGNARTVARALGRFNVGIAGLQAASRLLAALDR